MNFNCLHVPEMRKHIRQPLFFSMFWTVDMLWTGSTRGKPTQECAKHLTLTQKRIVEEKHVEKWGSYTQGQGWLASKWISLILITTAPSQWRRSACRFMSYPLSEVSDWVSVRLSPSCLDWLLSLGTLLLLWGQWYTCGCLLPPLLP